MAKRLSLLLVAAAAAPAVAQQRPTAASATPHAASLFERDWVLMNWALKFYDKDRDVLLSPAEAQAAGAEFRQIADSNADGRVTPEEFRAARAAILAR